MFHDSSGIPLNSAGMVKRFFSGRLISIFSQTESQTVSRSTTIMEVDIINANLKAVYTSCFSHRLNVSIDKTWKIEIASNTMEQIKELSSFFLIFQIWIRCR